MVKKIYVSKNKTATFVCPECGKIREMNLAKYKKLDQSSKVTCKCSCGHTYPVLLVQRQFYRKKTDLVGIYTYIISSFGDDYCEEIGKGIVKIKDLSRTGLLIEVNKNHSFKKDDKLLIEFTLDDKKKSLIKKEVIVKKVEDQLVGVEFIKLEPGSASDKAIAFYLF